MSSDSKNLLDLVIRLIRLLKFELVTSFLDSFIVGSFESHLDRNEVSRIINKF